MEGSGSPSKWNMGWNNTFRYKDLTLSMLIDFRIGGKVVSMTEATLDGYGVSERTGGRATAAT